MIKFKYKQTIAVVGTLLLFLFFNNLTVTPPDRDGFVLTPFYRFSQIQGYALTDDTGARFVKTIPEYLKSSNLSFPYKFGANRTEKEIPYVDSFSVTRYLGGIHKDLYAVPGDWRNLNDWAADLCFKNPTGSWTFNRNLAVKRLIPYFETGYTTSDIILNFENVPWDLALNGGNQDFYGNTSPPGNYGEWKFCVKTLAQSLKDSFGPDASKLRIKIGTEYDSKKSWTGSQADLQKLISKAFSGVTLPTDTSPAVFSDFKFILGEFAGTSDTGDNDVNFRSLAFDLAREYPSQSSQIVSALPRSLHYLPHETIKSTSNRSSSTINDYNLFYEALTGTGLDSTSTPPEIHQFGILGEKAADLTGVVDYDHRSLDTTGSRQAAWAFQMMFRLQRKMNFPTISHWSTFDSVKLTDGTEEHLFTGKAWLYQILDNLIGSEVRYLNFEKPTISVNAEHLVVGFKKENKLVIVVSSFTPDPVAVDPLEYAKVVIPEALLGGKTPTIVNSLRLHEGNNVHKNLRDDLKNAGNLKPLFINNEYIIARLKDMAVDFKLARSMLKEIDPISGLERKDVYRLRAQNLLTLSKSKSQVAKSGNVYLLPVNVFGNTQMQVFEVNLE